MADINSEVVLGMFLQQLIMETTFMFIVLTLAQVPAERSEENDNTEGDDSESLSGECVDDEETGSEEIELDFTDNAASENQNPRKRSRDGDNEASGLGYLIKVAKIYIVVSVQIKSMLLRQIGHDDEESEDRRRVVEELSKLPGFSSRDRIRVVTRIATNQAVVHLFLSLSDVEKEEMVEMMLDGTL